MPNTYVTAALIETRLGAKLNEYLDLAVASDPTTDTRLLAIIDDVNSTIDDHLRSKYNLPLATVPESIIRIGTDLSVYWLLVRVAKARLHEADETTFRDSMKSLRNLAQGRSGVTLATSERSGGGKSKGVLLADQVTEAQAQTATNRTWFKTF